MTTDAAAGRPGASTRWRIVGWIVLTTALALLAVTVTTRSVMMSVVAERTNAAVVQEIDEFRTFAAEGVDPTTARPFESTEAMVERYLARQTPETGEALIGVAGVDAATAPVRYVDNVGGGIGARLAQDRARVQQILEDPAASGTWDTDDGELRWGTAAVEVAGQDAQAATLIVAHFTARDREAVERETLVLAAVAAGGLLFTAGIAWIVAGRILKPLRHMRDAASRISATDLSARVPVEGDDDAATLARAINGLLDRVQHAHRDQQEFSVQARRHLAEPRERVRQAVRLLADPSASSSDRRHAAEVAEAGLDEMRATMDALGTLARQHTPEFVTPAAVPVDALVARAYAHAVRTHPERRWRLDPAPTEEAWLDADRVGEALGRLCDNAAEHSPADVEIALGAETVHQDGVRLARLWVANAGPGLSQDEAERVFAEFRSSDAEDTGMGFGLAVVRAVADAHRGSAWVESDPDGLTRFGLDLPADRPAEDAADRFAEDVTASLREES